VTAAADVQRDAAEVRGVSPAARFERRDELARWLTQRVGATSLTIDDIQDPPLNGASNETLMVDATWTTADGRPHQGGFVVRTPPKGFQLFHHYDLEAQYRTMAALTASDVPVPPLVGLELDRSVLGEPFYAMEKVEGRAPPDLPPFTAVGWVLESTPEQQAHLYRTSIEMLGRVHRVDVDACGLGFLRTGEGESGFHEQLLRAERWFDWAAEGRPQPTLDAVLAWLRANRPSDPPLEGLDWGDARIGNVLYRDFEPVGVLDWEMAAIGPAEVDLGWWLFLNRHHTVGMGIPPLPGFPDDATTVAMWEESLGREARDVFYYDVFAGFRFGIVVLRAARKMLAEGRMPPDSNYEHVNGCTTLLADMLGLPAPR
jgi:aminoglycoside phosphotransferase (APT) family kinase protein